MESIADQLAGRKTERLGVFHPVPLWDKAKKGARILGTYKSSRLAQTKGAERGHLVHDFVLNAPPDGVTFVAGKAKDPIDVQIGDVVTVRGAYLDTAMKDLPTGSMVLITFQGYGPREGARSAPALLEAEIVR